MTGGCKAASAETEKVAIRPLYAKDVMDEFGHIITYTFLVRECMEELIIGFSGTNTVSQLIKEALNMDPM